MDREDDGGGLDLLPRRNAGDGLVRGDESHAASLGSLAVEDRCHGARAMVTIGTAVVPRPG
jgi:hypothetical protein